MAANNLHNLATIIKRLEAATSRLEDIASSSFDPAVSPTPLPNGAASTPIPAGPAGAPGTSKAIETSAVTAAPTPPPSKSADLPEVIKDYDELIEGDLAKFVSLSEALDPLLAEQAHAFKGVWDAQRKFLIITTKAKKPAVDGLIKALQPTQEAILSVEAVREKNRGSPWKDHLSMVSDGCGTLGWVTVEPKPFETVAELFGGAQMYGNKVLRHFKDKEPHQVEWVNTFYALVKSLVAYVKKHYFKSLTWNDQGVELDAAMDEVNKVQTAPSTSRGGPPPPPPMPAHLGGAGGPPPPPVPKAAGKPADMGAVFQQLNQGEAITSGLKKVDPSQQTHKNPTLRAAAPVPTRSDSHGSSKSSPPTKPKPESMRTKKPARKELDGNKWIIENFDSPSAPIEIKAELNHSILITKCKNVTIQVSGKANAISIDSSTKTSLIVESLVSSVDVIKCPSFAIQVLDSIPTILLDQVDGATVYLSQTSLETEVLTSKCSSVNIYLPPVSESADYKECNIPEQLRSYIKDGKLVTEIVEHKG